MLNILRGTQKSKMVNFNFSDIRKHGILQGQVREDLCWEIWRISEGTITALSSYCRVFEPRGFDLLRSTERVLMIYREPDFLAVVWFGSSPTFFPLLLSANCLSFSLPFCRRSSLLTGEGGVGGPNYTTARMPETQSDLNLVAIKFRNELINF